MTFSVEYVHEIAVKEDCRTKKSSMIFLIHKIPFSIIAKDISNPSNLDET